jgi:hypothetical protein
MAAELPPLIPHEKLLGSPKRFRRLLSPDGLLVWRPTVATFSGSGFVRLARMAIDASAEHRPPRSVCVG